MAKCPNCGQKTARTEDWACPWCGYPLLSGSHKKIPKTYQQLKEEKLPDQKPPVMEEPEPISEPEPVAEPEPIPEPEPVPESAPAQVPKPKRKTAPKSKRKPVPKSDPKPAPKSRRKPASKSAPEPVPESVPELAPAAIELTVEELLSAYATEGEAADTKFGNKTLRVTGVVDRIEIKDTLDIYYINLTSPERDLLQNIRCIFDRQHGPELNQLTTGQTVTVQGKYDGSIMDIRMSDCVLVH